jgi:hypothetical protein
VHPDRNWGTNDAARRALAGAFAEAHPVRPPPGGRAWRTGRRDGATAHLVARLGAAAPAGSTASFLLRYDTEPRHDTARVESSTDGGATWTPLALTLRAGPRGFTSDGTLSGYGGRHWWYVTAAVPAGTTHLRWSYRTDAMAQGRGVHVDRVRVTGSGKPTIVAEGWVPATS